MTDHSASLSWDVHVAPPEPMPGGDLAPGEKERSWSPISATLISGERDAVLVDALLTADQARDLAEWVSAHEKNLTSVYITHGHGDHWFHRSISPSADFRFMNVALRKSEQALREATSRAEFRNAPVPFPFHASLYEVVREDER